MIKTRGVVMIPQSVLDNADKVKYENYKVNTPEKFQIRKLEKEGGGEELMEQLAAVIGQPRSKLNYVYFSACQGAEPHTDKLPAKFEDTTFVIPLILPKTGRAIITAEECWTEVGVGIVYEFDHTKVHSMELDDKESGCVVCMVAIKK